MDPLERALRHTWRVDDAAADEVVPIPEGSVLRSPSVPTAWSVNAVRLERALPGLDVTAAEGLCAEQVSVPYRHLLVEHEPTALRLADEAREQGGWKVEVEVLMGLADPAAPGPRRDARVRDGTLDEVLGLLRLWLVEEGHPPRTVDDIVRRSRREHLAQPEERIVADHAGAPAAMATARFGPGGVAQVEDVYVVPAARGTGLGRAVTSAAARAAARSGADLVFIVADDQDWPKELYAKVGFAPLGRRTQLHREL